MSDKNRYFDAKQFIKYVWEHLFIVLIVAFVFAGILLAYGYKNGKFYSGSSNTIYSIVKQNRDAYFNQSTNFTDAYRPAGTVESRARVYIDFNYGNLKAGEKVDSNNILVQLSNDALLMCVSEATMDQIIDELDLNSYDDMKNLNGEELSWMVNKNMQGAHVMNIVVTDVDAKRAHDVAEKVASIFVDKAVEFGLAEDARILDPASMPSETNVVNKKVINKKSVLKHLIAGALIGLMLTLVALIIIYICKDSVRTYRDIEYVGFIPFGTIHTKKTTGIDTEKVLTKALESDFGKILMISPIDAYSEIGGIKENIEKFLQNSKTKSAVLMSGQISDDSIIDKMKNENDLIVILSDDIKGSADSLKFVGKSDAILMLSKYGKTLMRDLEDAYVLYDNTRVKNLGVVLVD